MANTVVSKSVGIQGSSQGNRVVYHIDTAATLDSDAFTFTYQVKNIYGPGQSPASDSDEKNINHYMRPIKMESVVNMGPNAITIDGKVFATGKWDFNMTGGVAIAQAKGNVVISGTSPNAVIVFRGQ
jgi:hypothetical protein|tara:strand:- start:672 stop:1052 length:381 start_codon:yes stop_codon:yes gene_type:complete